MPDILAVLTRQWKMIVALTLLATILAFIACLLTTKKYLGTATALPANPVLGDKASIFNANIEALYTALGSPDELDRIEGTSKLDTIYLALAKEYNLATHYDLDQHDPTSTYLAAMRMKKEMAINRTGYGELQIKVWDKSSRMAADLANAAMEKLNAIHAQLQAENNRVIMHQLTEAYRQKQRLINNTIDENSVAKPLSESLSSGRIRQDSLSFQNDPLFDRHENSTLLQAQLIQYAKLINEYELALKTAPRALLLVERARPSPYPDKPHTLQITTVAFVAALLFSFLLALFIESRKPAV